MPDTLPTIASQLRALMDEHGDSLDSLAAASGVNRRTINQCLHGRNVRSDSLERLARHYGHRLVLAEDEDGE